MFAWLPTLCFFLFVFPVNICAQDSNLTSLPSITTPTVLTTTSQSEISTTASPPKPLPKNTDISPCPCDMTINECDVNCCCDLECSPQDRNVFTECITFDSVVDDRLCFQNDIFFAINSKLKSNRTSDGLFCIFYDNYPERNFYKNPDLMNNITMFDEYIQKYSGWTFQRNPEKKKEYSTFYKSGNPMMIVYKNESLGILNLPRAITSEYCTDLNPASYLFDQTFQCVRPIKNIFSECQSIKQIQASTYFLNFKLVSSPEILKMLNATFETITTELINDLYESSLTTSFSVVKICKGINCYQFNGTDMINITTSYSMVDETCYNVVEKVFYEFIYLGTAGILDMNVEIHLIDVQGSSIDLSQTFGTEFKQTNRKPFRKSGNPGYVVSEPIMAGVLEQFILDQKTVQVINLNMDRNNWLTLPQGTASGDCSMTARIPINFGENIRTGCIIRVTDEDLRNLCSQLQNQTNNILLGNSIYSHVASFGNTSVKDVGDWVPILGINNQPDFLPFQEQFCSLSLGLEVRVIFAQIGSINNPQSKILGISYHFETRKHFYPFCPGVYCQSKSIHFLELSASVHFYDNSQPTIEISADPPLYQIGLPFDFFYPFVTNAAATKFISTFFNKALIIGLLIICKF